MKLYYPKLLDTTPIEVNIYNEGYNFDGTPKEGIKYNGKCRFSETNVKIRDADGVMIQLNGYAYIGEDIAPGVKQITGDVIINGVKYQIYKAARVYNPDGSVCYTKLELI